MFINTKAFFPMDFILQNGLPDLVTSRNSERENQHLLIGSLLLRLHDSIVSLPVLMLAVAAAMVLAGLSDKVVREKSSGVLWPKNHGKRYGSKMIQNHRSFPGFHSKADGKIRIMINLPGVHSVLHSRVTATDASIAFFISAKWLVAPRAEGVKGLLLLEQERWPVEVFSFYPKILIFRIMIFHGILSKKNGCSNLDLTKLPTQRWVIFHGISYQKQKLSWPGQAIGKAIGVYPVTGNDPLIKFQNLRIVTK